MENKSKFMFRAIELSIQSAKTSGGPFGCVIVKNNKIIAEGFNQVTSNNDPTAHAEIVAIRNACQNQNNFFLKDCDLYSTCEPCPMCLSAIYWAHIENIYYANTSAIIDFCVTKLGPTRILRDYSLENDVTFTVLK